MKKAILSPLGSALIIPGFGQIINQHLKKGVCILCAVFILFLAAMIKLYVILNTILKTKEIDPLETGAIMDRLRAEDLSALWFLLIVFVVLWAYSVLDAYLTGKKIDQLEEANRL